MNESLLPMVTIGVITALPKEYVAVKASLLDCKEHEVPGVGSGRRYTLGRIPSSHGGDNWVALALADMGNNVAAARAAQVLQHFPSVDDIIMVGIAGGIPNPDKPEDHVRLGDIVVSSKKGVVQYDMLKLQEIRACPIVPSARLLEAVRILEAGELEGKRPWDDHIAMILRQLNQKRPQAATDKLYATDSPDKMRRHPKDPKRNKNAPRVFLGPIASANTLQKDAKKRDQLRDQFSAKAIEMEGSGIADAAWQYGKGYLVIRGICDYCDAKKNDLWQEYAAAAAAGYVTALIGSLFASGARSSQNPR